MSSEKKTMSLNIFQDGSYGTTLADRITNREMRSFSRRQRTTIPHNSLSQCFMFNLKHVQDAMEQLTVVSLFAENIPDGFSINRVVFDLNGRMVLHDVSVPRVNKLRNFVTTEDDFQLLDFTKLDITLEFDFHRMVQDDSVNMIVYYDGPPAQCLTLLTKQTYYVNPELHARQETHFYSYNSSNEIEYQLGNKFLVHDNCGLTNGYFIQGVDLKNLDSIELYLNDHLSKEAKFGGRECLWKAYGLEKLEENVFYFPVTDNSYYFFDEDFFEGMAYRSVKIRITSLQPTERRAETISITCYGMTLMGYSNSQHCYMMSINGGLSITNEEEAVQVPPRPTPTIAMPLRTNRQFQVFRGPWSSVYEQLDQSEEDNLCPVLQTPIKTGDSYLKCNQCKKNFHKDIKDNWLLTHGTCPHCRSLWTNFRIYVNSYRSLSETA